jgi:DNA (cytosine-5)-methyltransferase 1
MARPIGIDLFAGVGGLSLGFERAGFDVAAAVEIDPVHACAHKYNFPDCAVIPRSVSDLTGDDIRRTVGLGSCKIDVVFGGAPCQGFSLIGRRSLDDPRNGLVLDFVRLVTELDASCFVFENVKGLTVGKHKAFLDEIIAAFDRAGYDVRRPWRVLNACAYGTPQDRERLFLLGTKKGMVLPDYPPARTQAVGRAASGDLPVGPSCGDALADIPDAELYPALLSGDSVYVRSWAQAGAYARQMRCQTEDAWAYGYKRVWDSNILTASLRTDHSAVSRRRFAETKGGTVEPISRFFRLPVDGVSNTLRAGTDSARGAFTSPRPIHYAYPRCVTVREMARLHGFPDWFRFHTTKWHGARQVGNAVPPPLAEAVATEVMKALGVEPARPGRVTAPGDPALLEMDMSQASAYWGIAAPIRKRDRKSGDRKRKQADIEAARLLSAGAVNG